MKRLNWILVVLVLMIGSSAVAQIQIPGGPIKPPVPPVKTRTKPKAKTRPKKTTTQKVKYYDVTFLCNAYDADLYIDGEYVDDANTTYPLKAGSHTVKVVTDYYNDYSTTINVSASNKSFNLNLTEKTDAESQLQLGANYYEGRSGFPKDYKKATQHLRKAADKGNAYAQNFVGICYLYGQGVTQDEEEAKNWFRKAAEQENVEAQCNIGYCYTIDFNYAEAVKWFKKAAEKGNDMAQNNLGFCYLFGRGVEYNYDEAVRWFKKAAAQGNENAIQNLKQLGL